VELLPCDWASSGQLTGASSAGNIILMSVSCCWGLMLVRDGAHRI
jgi:hypothetical protein